MKPKIILTLTVLILALATSTTHARIQKEKHFWKNGSGYYNYNRSVNESYNKINAYSDKKTQSVYIKTTFKKLIPRNEGENPAGLLILEIRRNEWWFFRSAFLNSVDLNMKTESNYVSGRNIELYEMTTGAAILLTKDEMEYIYNQNGVNFCIFFGSTEPHLPVNLIITNKIINEWAQIYGKIPQPYTEDKTIYPDCRFLDKDTLNQIDKHHIELNALKTKNTDDTLGITIMIHEFGIRAINASRKRTNSTYANKQYKDAKKEADKTNKLAEEYLPKIKTFLRNK